MHLEADAKSMQIVNDPEPPEPQLPLPKTAGEICRFAAALVEGDRAAKHGPKERNHQIISNYWNVYLRDKLKVGVFLTAFDAAMLMALLKIARTQSGEYNPDNFVDIAGYAGVAGEIAANGKET